MSWQFNDQPLLTHLFGSCLTFSLDILRVITDYLFKRELIAFRKNGVPSYLRFGPVLISGEIAYEIRAYNEHESHVFSTFETGVRQLENNKFSKLREEIVTNQKPWQDIFFKKQNNWPYYRYVFCPATKWTYIIRFSHPTNRIKISRRDKEGDTYSIGSFTPRDIKKTIIKYSRLIERYGEEWDVCPKLQKRVEGGERLRHWILKEMKGSTIL